MTNARGPRPPARSRSSRSVERDVTTKPSKPGASDAAIARATAFLRSKQLRSGAWIAGECFEPQSSATHLVVLSFVGRVPHVEARGYARFLVTLQREDGSWAAYPYAEGGDLVTTALVYAALEIAALDEQADARRQALAYIEENGGFEAVRDELAATGNLLAIFVAMAGYIDPFELPEPELAFILAPPVLDAMLKKMHAGIVESILFVGSVTRLLRERKRPSPAHVRKLHELEASRAADFVESWLNPNGNNNGVTSLTDMAIATLFACGRSPESPRLYSAIAWFNHHRVWDDRGLHLEAFTNENWMTAWSIRALLAAGVGADDPAIADGLDYLCWSQSKLPMPELNLRRKNAHRTGGWGFQEDNLLLVDTDDTGIVLSALGAALAHKGDAGKGELEPARRQRVQDAVDLALLNVLDMQNDDGGWAGFVWNLGSKQRGPLFDRPLAIPATFAERLRLMADVPLEMMEPAIEGLTGRVLQGLGANGFAAGSVEVQRAARFLEERQMPDGSFWARWIVGYLAATSSVVSGLANCGWDLSERWLQRAIEYLLAKQNDDGGWGETPAAYERPHAGIVSPSMPPLTGVVLVALVDAGLAKHPAVDRAMAYLLQAQRADGGWDSNGWLQIMQPYASYYDFEGEAWYRPLEALAKIRAARAEVRARPTPAKRAATTALAVLPAAPPAALARVRTQAKRWSGAELRKMRVVGDAPADAAAQAALTGATREALHAVMTSLTAGRDPHERDLPAPIREHFERTSAMPSWADPKRILRGQKLFTRHGWIMAAGFFCSSLPQAYCAANGARVLAQTQGMTRNVKPRILETAQFVFDVCAEGSLEPGGPGIRAAQRIRMLHAVIRHLMLSKGEWDSDKLGVPINQEDLSGTLMTFSVVLLDALRTAGFEVSREEEEDFYHLWKVVGHYLGVAPALVPVDVADARALMQVIREDQWSASVQGKLLTSELMAAMREYLPGRLFDDLPAVLIRFFAPAPAPALLGIAESGSMDLLLGAGKRLGSLFGIASSDETRRNLVRKLSRDLMVGIIGAQRGMQKATFRVPATLARGWDLAPPS